MSSFGEESELLASHDSQNIQTGVGTSDSYSEYLASQPRSIHAQRAVWTAAASSDQSTEQVSELAQAIERQDVLARDLLLKQAGPLGSREGGLDREQQELQDSIQHTIDLEESQQRVGAGARALQFATDDVGGTLHSDNGD